MASASSTGVTGTDEARAETARRERGLRRATLVLIVMLLAEFVLGLAVSLYATVNPTGGGMFSAFGHALTKGPGALAAHAGVGILLVLAGIGLVVQSLLAGRKSVIVYSIVALIAILGAWSSGSSFVAKGNDADSMVMGCLTAVALLCASLVLYVLGGERRERTDTAATE